MLKEFNKICNIILESGDAGSQEIKPRCAYCWSDVSIESYEKQNESFKEKMGHDLSPTSCVCEKCAEGLMKMYSNKSGNWTGD